MSFQQIHKHPTKETNKEKDNFSKDNPGNQDYNQSYYSNSSVNFNFSNIDIFDTEKVIQRKPKCTCRGKCTKCLETADQQTNIPNIQPKLKISQPNDPLEKEADEVAEHVMRMSSHEELYQPIRNLADKKINRKCKSCEKEEEESEELKKMKFSRKENKNSSYYYDISDHLQSYNVLSQEGKSLDASTREFMESRFGYDFGKVRIHTDERSSIFQLMQ